MHRGNNGRNVVCCQWSRLRCVVRLAVFIAGDGRVGGHGLVRVGIVAPRCDGVVGTGLAGVAGTGLVGDAARFVGAVAASPGRGKGLENRRYDGRYIV